MKIRIQTTQNVELEYEVAGLGYRFVAALIDFGIMILYVLLWVLALLAMEAEPEVWVMTVFIGIPITVYPLLCELFMEGQTFGKRIMKLKVVRIDGGQPTAGAFILRWLLWIIEGNPMLVVAGTPSIGMVSIVATDYGQRLGDIAAGTTVVRMTTEEEVESAFLRPLGSAAQITWPQAAQLSDRDVQTIRATLDAVERGADPIILSTAAYRVADALGIERSQVRSHEYFLKAILNDARLSAA